MKLHDEMGAVRRETVLDAPRDEVWALVAEPGGLATWLADEVELDAVTPGARGTVREDGEERLVTVEEVVEGRRVALTWWAVGGDASLVEVTLDDDGDARTRLVVVEIPLAALRTAVAPIVASGPAHGPQLAMAA